MQTAEGINAGGIASAKLADGAVTSAKIADGGVGTADLAAKAVTDAKLSDAVAYKVNGGGILWSGSWYVSNEQTVALSRAVSEQRTGIVLVFSAWSDSGANNATSLRSSSRSRRWRPIQAAGGRSTSPRWTRTACRSTSTYQTSP